MWTSVAVAVCLLAAGGGALPPRGPREAPHSRIVGGEEADISQVPWQVAVLLDGRHVCSGSIVSPKWVLTAAQCIHLGLESRYEVRAGSSQWCDGGAVYKAERLYVRGHFSSETNDYDIGLIRVEGMISFGDNVKMAKLGTQEPAAGTSATVCGWGATSSDAHPCTLRCATVEVQDRCSCNQTYGGAITERMICAGAQEGCEASGPCWGDTGAPLVAGNTQHGVVSQPWHCGEPGLPSVYTSVASMRTWIRDTAGV